MEYTKTEDFSEKERNRAIGITDIAISRIKKVHFSGFTPEQDEEIYNHHINHQTYAPRWFADCKAFQMPVSPLSLPPYTYG